MTGGDPLDIHPLREAIATWRETDEFFFVASSPIYGGFTDL